MDVCQLLRTASRARLVGSSDAEDLLGVAFDARRHNKESWISWLRKSAVSYRRDRGGGRRRVPNQDLHAASRHTQIHHVNRTLAEREDDRLPCDDINKRQRVQGRGAWKRMLTSAVLRHIFSCPGDTIRAEARQCNSAASTVLHMKCMGANLLKDMQESAIAEKLQAVKRSGGFAILTIMWDYSQLWLNSGVGGQQRGVDCNIMAAHGFLTYAAYNGGVLTVREDEVILRPCHTSSCTAADTWAALRAIVPPAVWSAIFDEAVPPNTVLGITVAGDHAATNTKVMTHIETVVPERVVAFNTYCKSHGTALCISQCVKRCNVLAPGFCLAKQFRKEAVMIKFWAGVRASLMKHLVLVCETDQPQWKPRASDLAHTAAVLELTFYQHDLRTASPTVAASCAQPDKLRRQRGETLREKCAGDWRRKAVVYWARAADVVQTREGAIDWLVSHLQRMRYGAFGDVSESKWISAYQMILDISFMTSFHHVFAHAMRHALGMANEADQDSLSSLSESEKLHLPSSSQAWHQNERRRALKALRWVENPETMPTNLIFLHGVGIVMRSHWHFFKHGHMPPRGEERSFLFDLCDIPKSLGAGILKDLDALTRGEELWAPILHVAGPFSTWPECRVQLARECCSLLYGQAMRRLVRCFTKPPFCFVPMVDPRLAPAARRKLAERLFNMREELLPDSMLRIRQLAGSVDAIMAPFWQSFLFHQWNKLPLTTQLIECMFASFKQWRLKVQKSMSTTLLAAKHTCFEFQRACKRKRGLDKAIDAPRPKRARPKWILKRGEHARYNRFHMHVRACIRARPRGQSVRDAFSGASSSYDPRALGPIVQAQRENALQQQCKRASMQQVAIASNDGETAWDLGDGCFPLKACHVQSANKSQASRNEHVRRWKDSNLMCNPAPDFPDRVVRRKVLSAEEAAWSTDERSIARDILDELGIVFANRAQKRHRSTLVLVTAASGHSAIVACGSCSRNYPFTGDFFEYARKLPSGEWKTWALEPFVVPAVVTFASEPLVPGGPVLASCIDELTLTAHILSLSSGPRTYQPVTLARLGPGQHLFKITVTDVDACLDVKALRQEHLDNQKALQATRLLKEAQQPHAAAQKRSGMRHHGGVQEGDGRARAHDGHMCSSEGQTPSGHLVADLCPDLVTSESESDKAADFQDALDAQMKHRICEAEGSPTTFAGDVRPVAEAPTTRPPEAIPAVPPNVPPPLAVVCVRAAPASGRMERQVLDQFDIEVYGLIKIDRKLRSLNAHCMCQGPAPWPDHRSGHALTPCRMNRVASKRPLGLLVAWLRKNAHPSVTDRRSHVAQVPLITKEDRDQCREWLRVQPSLAEVLAFEAEACGVDVVDEPEYIF